MHIWTSIGCKQSQPFPAVFKTKNLDKTDIASFAAKNCEQLKISLSHYTMKLFFKHLIIAGINVEAFKGTIGFIL